MALAALRTNRPYPLVQKGPQLAPILHREHEELAEGEATECEQYTAGQPPMYPWCHGACRCSAL